MNQFRLDLDATRCAQAHQDAHCGKMLCELMQQACTAFPEPRSARLRFPDTVNISDHVENVLLVEHDPQTQEFVVPWARVRRQIAQPQISYPMPTRTAIIPAPSGLGPPAPTSTTRSS